MNTVAVFGASGFIGTTLVEHLLATGEYRVRPFINSGKNAWRLARLGLDLERADVFDPDDIIRALHGCSYVVNCIMGPRPVMFKGLKNLLTASQTVGVKRFVHLSSITAYGEPPPPESVHEEARPRPQRGTYGWIKMIQDNMVLKATAKGLPCVVLCPPIVSGPRSIQLMWLLKCINEHRFALIDEGDAPCAVVDVVNLSHAIVLALKAGQPDGKRIFVLDDKVPTWHQVLDEMMPVFNPSISYPTISLADAKWFIEHKDKISLSPAGTLKHLMSPQVGKILGEDPLIRSVQRTVKQLIPQAALKSLKQNSSGRKNKIKVKPETTYDTLQLARQLRGVFHSGDRAVSILGYSPLFSFAESMEQFRTWYINEKGWANTHADLIKNLER